MPNEHIADYESLNTAFRYLCNSYDNAVDEQSPCAWRGLMIDGHIGKPSTARRQFSGIRLARDATA